MQTDRNSKECQGIKTIAWKNEKQYIRLQLSIPGTQGAFSHVLMVLLIIQQFNVMFKCMNENTFHCRWFQINDTNDIYTNGSE